MKNALSNVTLRIHARQILGILNLREINKKFDTSGYYSRFILLLQQYLGFRYEITTLSLTESIELIQKNRIDLSLPTEHSFHKSKVMDFSPSLDVPGIKFLVGKPSELSKITAIVRPFFIQVWISIFITFIISVIIFNIIFWIDAKLYKRKYVKVKEIAWALFGSFTAQGNDLFFPSGKSCQLLVSGWILAMFIITSSYSGALMSFITFPGREPAPRTFSQLVKMGNNGDYIITFNFNTFVKKFIFNSIEGPGVELKKLLELNKIEDRKLDESFANRIAKEKFVYISYEPIIYPVMERFGADNFLVSEDQLVSIAVGFGMSKKFPYKKEINEATNRFRDAGLYMKYVKDEMFENQKKHQSIVEENEEAIKAMNITDLAGPFLLLIIGYFLSIVVFFFELIVKKMCG